MTPVTINTLGFNGTTLNLQPSDHHWVARPVLGKTGDRHAIYPIYRTYEMSWELVSDSEYNQLLGFYSLVGTTGTLVATLPQYGTSTYQMHSYSGVTLDEPEYSNYFEGYYQNVKLTLNRIIT